MSLVSPSGDLITIHCAGPMFYLRPKIARFDQGTFDFICDSVKFQLAAITLKRDETYVAGAGTTDTSTSKKAIFYHADRWKLEGQTLTRLHKRPRKTLFVPVGTKDLPVDPDELIELRTTEVTFADGRTQVLEDSWRLAEDPTMVLDPTQTWTGKTIFKLKSKPPTTRLSTKTNITTDEEPQLKIVSEGTSSSSTSRPVIVEKRLVDQKHVDFGSESFRQLVLKLRNDPDVDTGHVRTSDCWHRLPNSWIRFHFEPRTNLFIPSLDDQQLVHKELGTRRMTLKLDAAGRDTWINDTWQYDSSSENDLGETFEGATCFEITPVVTHELAEPLGEDRTAQKPRTFSVPVAPSPEEVLLHNLTHLPFRSWCSTCVKAKSRESHALPSSTQPVIQLDYSFMTSESDPTTQVTLLNAVDVTTKLGMSCVVPRKGRSRYAKAELKRFIFEVGRTYGLLQHDPEASLKALVEQVLEDLGGMTSRQTPVGWKQAQGAVGNLQSTLYGQIRTLVLHVKDTYDLELPCNSTLFPWTVKHAQWLLNRYLIHSDGLTSWQRRWGKPYDRAICNFLEAVTFKLSGQGHKGTSSWKTGLWVGKCTESDEHILLTSEGAFKARSIRRRPLQEQIDRELAQVVTGLPWSPKDNSKDQDKDTFVFPAGQLLRTVTGQDEELKTDKAEEEPELQDPNAQAEPMTPQEAEELEEPRTPRTRPRDGEEPPDLFSRLPVRRRITRNFGVGSPKREATETELLEIEESRSKVLRVSSITSHGICVGSYICEVGLKNGDLIDIHVNEEPEEKKHELMSQEPLLWFDTELDHELVKAGMKREIQSLKDFDVFEEVPTDSLTQEQLRACIPTGWVHKPKALEVKSRIVVRGYAEQVQDKDDTFASTPSFTTLKLLLVLAVARNWHILGADVSTAFLHALWTGIETFIWPPPEFYPNGGAVWRLKRALYGMKSSPRMWQDHFSSCMQKFDFIRCKSDANLYKHSDGNLFVLCYVDDLLIVGEKDKAEATFQLLSSEFLMKQTGTLCNEGDKLNFLGRQLTRTSDSVCISMDPTYVARVLEESEMTKCRVANTPGTDALKKKVEDENELDREAHKAYRKLVGQLLWLAPVRPDIAYAVKELSRGVSKPTFEHFAKAKHLLRYLHGTCDYCIELKPKLYLHEKNTSLTVTCHTDSDWAGCTSTRKSTSGVLCSVLGATISALSRTQQTLALSSGEAELYALGLGVAESLFIKSLVLEAGFATSCNITLFTDSSAGKSMSNRWGTTRKTKHIELRFLFVQELITSGIITVRKILGTLNPADILTKYVSKDTLERHLSNAGALVRHLKSQPNYLSNIHVDRTTFVCGIFMSTSTDFLVFDSLHSYTYDHFHFILLVQAFYTCTLPVIMQLMNHIFEARLVYLATCIRSTLNLELTSRMNAIRMDKLIYVKDLKLSEPQELQVGLADADPHFDFEMMLGKDFETFSTKTEQAVWKGLQRTPLQNFPTGDTSGLTHFTFYTVLPVQQMTDFLIKKELNSKDFSFTGKELPINLSLNARSALLFFQFSQTLAHGDNLDNFSSDFWLVTFRLEVSHFALMKQSGTLGLWNRLYIDHLFTCWEMKLSDQEWSTLRTWKFVDETSGTSWKVRELVEKLNAEILSNSSSHLRRLYHLVLDKEFFNLHFTDTEEDNNWDLITSEATNFDQHLSTMQSLKWLENQPEEEAGPSQAMGSTLTTSTPVVVRVVADDDFPQIDGSTQTRAVDTSNLVDEVFTSEGGCKFHFVDSCKGLAKRSYPLRLVSIEEAKADGRDLCKHCADLTHLRTVVCCTQGCTYRPTWHPHFCCKRCKDNLTGEHGRLCSKVTFHPVEYSPTAVTFTRNSAGSVV